MKKRRDEQDVDHLIEALGLGEEDPGDILPSLGDPDLTSLERHVRLDEQRSIDDRRRHARLSGLIIPSSATRLGDDGWAPITAVILNMSAGGLLVASDQELRVGDYLDFVFTLRSGGGQLHVRVDVLRVETQEHRGVQTWKGGSHFHEPHAAFRDIFAQFIFEQQRERRGRSANRA